MARSFNDATDRIDYTRTWNPKGSPITVSMWVYRTMGAEHAYLWHIGLNDSTYGILLSHEGSVAQGTVQFMRNSATDLVRYTNSSGLPASQWTHVLVTHDGTITDATAIHIYTNGVENSYSFTQNGATESDYAATYESLGGRTYDDNRNFGGYLAEVGVWNRVVSAGEIAQLAVGFSPANFRSGLQRYVPLIRGTLDWVNGDYGTLDGTAAADHPPKIKPWWFRPWTLRRAAAAAPRSELMMMGVG